MTSLSEVSLLNMQASSGHDLPTASASASRKRKSGFDSVRSKRNKRSNSEVSSDVSVQYVGTQRRASSRQADRSSRASQMELTQTAPEGATNERSPVKVTNFTSPSANSIGQVSGSSQILDTPSTAPSSVMPDEGIDVVSPTIGSRLLDAKSIRLEQTHGERMRSRSSSVGSTDTVTRSSARARKPTIKAQALADAGTKFYRTLRKSFDSFEHEEETDQTDTLPDTMTVEPATLSVSSQVEKSEPDESVVTSVEPASVRTSPRQRKPTAKAAAAVADAGTATSKRTLSPADSVRSVKSLRVSSAVPDKPSKLRYSISSDENDEDTQPRTETVQSNAEGLQQQKFCHLNCLSPSSRLLVFARFAAKELDTDDDEDEDDDTDLASLLAAAAIEDNRTYDSATKIANDHCTCVAEGSREILNQAATQSAPPTINNADMFKEIESGGDSNAKADELTNRNSLASSTMKRLPSTRAWRESATTSKDVASSTGTAVHGRLGETSIQPMETRKTRASLRKSLPSSKGTYERKMQEDYVAAQTDERSTAATRLVTNIHKAFNEAGSLPHAHGPTQYGSTANGEPNVATTDPTFLVGSGVIKAMGRKPEEAAYNPREDTRPYDVRHATSKPVHPMRKSQSMTWPKDVKAEAPSTGISEVIECVFVEPLKTPNVAHGRPQAYEGVSSTKENHDPPAKNANVANTIEPSTYNLRQSLPESTSDSVVQQPQSGKGLATKTVIDTRHRRKTMQQSLSSSSSSSSSSNKRSPRASRSTMVNGHSVKAAVASELSSPTPRKAIARPSKKIILRYTPASQKQQ